MCSRSDPLSHSSRPPENSLTKFQRIGRPASHPTAHNEGPTEPVPEHRRLFPVRRLQIGCNASHAITPGVLRNCSVDRRQIAYIASGDKRAIPKAASDTKEIGGRGGGHLQPCRVESTSNHNHHPSAVHQPQRCRRRLVLTAADAPKCNRHNSVVRNHKGHPIMMNAPHSSKWMNMQSREMVKERRETIYAKSLVIVVTSPARFGIGFWVSSFGFGFHRPVPRISNTNSWNIFGRRQRQDGR